MHNKYTLKIVMSRKISRIALNVLNNRTFYIENRYLLFFQVMTALLIKTFL